MNTVPLNAVPNFPRPHVQLLGDMSEFWSLSKIGHARIRKGLDLQNKRLVTQLRYPTDIRLIFRI